MKIFRTSLIMVFAICISCTQIMKPTLTGEIINNDNIKQIKVISLETGYTVIDSIQVTGQSFDFNLTFNDKKLLQIRANDYRLDSPLFFYEPGLNYELRIDNNQAVITGPKNSLQENYNDLLKELNPLNEKLSEISRDTVLSKAELDVLSTKHFKNLIDLKKDYIQKHPKSFLSLYLLKDMLDLGSVLSYHELKTFFGIVNIDVHQGSPMLDFIGTRLKDIEDNRMVGRMTPSFSLESPEGKVYTPEDFKGAYTLIDFWASWCAPCRVANKKVIPLYEKYKDRGFKVISISFDDNKEKWIKAIEEDQIPWVQVSDLKGFKPSEIRELYKVKSLPTTYVLDPEGKVVDQHLKHHELERLLESIYQN